MVSREKRNEIDKSGRDIAVNHCEVIIIHLVYEYVIKEEMHSCNYEVMNTMYIRRSDRYKYTVHDAPVHTQALVHTRWFNVNNCHALNVESTLCNCSLSPKIRITIIVYVTESPLPPLSHTHTHTHISIYHLPVFSN